MNHCCVKLPVLSCPFPEGHVHWGGLPTPACPLGDAVICISLLMAILSDSGWRWAGLCWVAVGPQGSGRRSPQGLALAGTQLQCWLCLALTDLVGLFGGFAFFPASESTLFTPNTLIELIVSVLLWNQKPGVCCLPFGHVWVIWAL